jgi:hypothetical protein
MSQADATQVRILVTGSRTWVHPAHIRRALNDLASEHGHDRLVVVHGACPRGADLLASRWAAEHQHLGVREERHPADWDRYGKAAGFRRNAEMVAAGAHVVLAFIRAGSAGASHTADLAEKAGIPTRRWTA